MELDDRVRQTNHEYRDGNMVWWRQRLRERFGVSIPEPKKEDDAVGHTVRVGSPEHHYHQELGNVGKALLGALLAVAIVAAGLLAWNLARPKSDTSTVAVTTPQQTTTQPIVTNGTTQTTTTTTNGVPVFDPGGLKIEVIKGTP